jgi:phosphopantetheine--protein transferase-like protein
MLHRTEVLRLEQIELALAQVAPHPMRAAYCQKSGEWLHDFSHAQRLRPSVSLSRRQEFTSGRHCASQALKCLGVSMDCSMIPDEDGLPTWPNGFVGSISHCREQVVAVAASADAVVCVGIDIEDVNRLSPAAADRILSETEMDWVRGSRRLASLVFSAKEAIYKAYYPHYRRSANFKDVHVVPVKDTPCLRVLANPERFSKRWSQQIELFTVRYTFIDSYVLCCSYLLKSSATQSDGIRAVY